MILVIRKNKDPVYWGSAPPQVETFSKTLTHSQDHPFPVARAQLTFQMLTLLKRNIYTTRASVKNMGEQMSVLDSSNG